MIKLSVTQKKQQRKTKPKQTDGISYAAYLAQGNVRTLPLMAATELFLLFCFVRSGSDTRKKKIQKSISCSMSFIHEGCRLSCSF